MALLETNDTIKDYYDEVKDQYPDIPFEQFKTICKTPFRFFKMKIETEEMPTIFIKYFGKFKVHATTIKRLLRELKVKKDFNIMRLKKAEVEYTGEARYQLHKSNLEARLKIVEENDNLRRIEKDNKKASSTN